MFDRKLFYRNDHPGKNFSAYQKRILKKYTQLDKQIFYLSQAQSFQDVFVHQQFTGKGFYIEVGANHPIDFNNTYTLETLLGWQGVSIEIKSNFSSEWSVYRTNPLIIKDARMFDFSPYTNKQIQYMSIDIDDIDASITVLNNMMIAKVQPTIITAEVNQFNNPHDMAKIKNTLNGAYYTVCDDVHSRDSVYARKYEYEIWFCHKSHACAPFLYQNWAESLEAEMEVQTV